MLTVVCAVFSFMVGFCSGGMMVMRSVRISLTRLIRGANIKEAFPEYFQLDVSNLH